MRVTFSVLLLTLLFSGSFAVFFPKIFGNKQVKDSKELELDTVELTKDYLENNRISVVGCAILLRYAYSLHHQTIAKGLANGIKLNNTDHDISEKLYFSNLESCLSRISEDVAAQITNNKQNTRYFDKAYQQLFIINDKTIKTFIKQGTELSENQNIIKAFIKSELEGEYSQTLPYFNKIKSSMAIKRERKEKYEASDKFDEFWEIGLILGGVALVLAFLLYLANNRKETYSSSRKSTGVFSNGGKAKKY